VDKLPVIKPTEKNDAHKTDNNTDNIKALADLPSHQVFVATQ